MLLSRDVIDEYGKQVVKLAGNLMKILSVNLGLEEDRLQDAFGGEDIGACLRVNFYPKCPQPDLALGLSSHSDPGGMTILLPDSHVAGLQVRKDGNWITVKPARHAFIVNIGDQIQVIRFFFLPPLKLGRGWMRILHESEPTRTVEIVERVACLYENKETNYVNF